MTESVLCVDIGGSSSKAGVLDGAGQLHFVSSIATHPGSETYFRALCELIERTRDQAHGQRIAGLGVAIAGFLDPEKTRMVYNSNLPWLENFPLRERLHDHFAMPVELEVDSNSACMAEYHFGSGRGSRRFLCVAVGTGLGAGMTVDGEPLRFAYGCLGDIGHVIVQPRGPECTCGGRGCAEILLSAPALAERFCQMTSAAQLSLRDVIDEGLAGNPAAVTVLREAGEWLGIALASMANILFPDHIAVAGGLSAAGDLVLGPAESMFREAAGVKARSGVSFTRALLGPSSTLVGAGWPFWKKQERPLEN